MNNIVLTKASVFRNVKDYKFSPKLEENKRTEIAEKVKKALNLPTMNVQEIETSVLNYLKNYNLIEKQAGQIMLKKEANVVINLFAGEHITITSSAVNFNSSVINNAIGLAHELDGKLTAAYSDQYGFLMSNLQNVGCGLKLECLINLFAIKTIGKIEQVKQNVKNLGYALHDYAGDVYCLSTICNLGKTESEIIAEFEKMAIKLQELEIESAKMLSATNSDQFMDKVFRSLAILKSAHLLDLTELSMHLSMIRLGNNLDFISLTPSAINELQVLALNKMALSSKADALELARKVRNILKGENNV